MLLSLTYAHVTTYAQRSSAAPQSPRLDHAVPGLRKRKKMRGDARPVATSAIGGLSLSRMLTALLCAGLTLSASAQDKDVRLPDLGSSANALISPQEAQQYGASMLRQMRALDMVVDDPMLDDYINDLGYRLVAGSEKPKDHFVFFIAKDPVINAFAAPGGYIVVNSGLVIITDSESELAGVIAHEIGHITQNHLQRAFEASKKDTPLMALVLLGAIAAGAGAGAGDAAGGLLLGGQGLLMQKPDQLHPQGRGRGRSRRYPDARQCRLRP